MLIKELHKISADEFVDSYRHFLSDFKSTKTAVKTPKYKGVSKVDNLVGVVKGILFYELDMHFSNFQHTETIKDIIFHETDLYLENEDFEEYTKSSVNEENSPFDIIYDILTKKGEPMHLSEIFVKFKEILPNHKYTEAEQLRRFIHQHPDIISKNRKSVFMLKEWKHIKSGTIRGTVIEFLNRRKTPKPLDDIMGFLLQHFPETNVASVKASIVNDEKKRFSFFKGGLFGLSHKKYPREYKKIKYPELSLKRESFDVRLQELETFLIKNERFPSTLGDKNEKSIYNWWRNVLTGKYQTNKEQLVEVERINTEYAKHKKNSRRRIVVSFVPQERRKLNLCTDEISKVSEQHSETVQLLNRVLEDDEITTHVSEHLEQQPNGFSSLHLELLDMFIKNNHSLSKIQVEDFAKSNGVMANRLIGQINDLCYDILDDIIIEENDDCWTVSEDYLNAITDYEH